MSEEQARALVEAHGIEWQPEAAFHRAIAAALCEATAKVWEEAAIEHDKRFGSEFGAFSQWCRTQAQARKEGP